MKETTILRSLTLRIPFWGAERYSRNTTHARITLERQPQIAETAQCLTVNTGVEGVSHGGGVAEWK